jgi:hypothetical protein
MLTVAAPLPLPVPHSYETFGRIVRFYFSHSSDSKFLLSSSYLAFISYKKLGYFPFGYGVQESEWHLSMYVSYVDFLYLNSPTYPEDQVVCQD